MRAELEAFSPTVVRRGESYVHDGRVAALHAEPDRVEAQVHGSTEYRVLWWWNGRRWAHECTCPFGAGCKHAYAVASSVVDGSGDDAAPTTEPLSRLRDARALWERQAAMDELLVEAPASSLTP